MIRKLIDRPIAVSMTLIAVIILGFVSTNLIPVSLMPEVDIPQITVQVEAPGTGARELDASIVRPLRQQFMQITSLKEIKTESTNDVGTLTLKFNHGADIDFLFIEVNEKIDRAIGSNYLPSTINRPKVIKASVTDIPAFFINITPKDGSKLLELSTFSTQVLSKRIEQIPEVAFVDISGLVFPQLMITPDNAKLASLNLTTRDLEQAINNNNYPLGNLSIRDGEYQWDIRFRSEINSKEDIERIKLNINGRIYSFNDLATVKEEPRPASCVVRSNGDKSVTMAVIKQSDAKMSKLQEELTTMLEYFEKDYPDIDFEVTRDQTELLSYSISNLRDNIIVGAILACFIIFLFMQDFRSPILISLTIPLSLVISLLCFYLVGISINIISLSGLILGIGMMVDNSIIVIDNISQIWDRGLSLKESVVKGAGEVFTPMLSSVLTTCSVFVPMIFLSGMAGALFYDQAMAVAISLFSSLFVSVLVIPVYYYSLYRKSEKRTENVYLAKFTTRFNAIPLYERILKWFFRHQYVVLLAYILSIPLAWVLFTQLDKSTLPKMSYNDILLSIDWNKSISVEENDRRTINLIDNVREDIVSETSMIGVQQFLMSHTPEMERSEAMIYIKASEQEDISKVEKKITDYMIDNFPEASFEFSPSGNIFDMIFSDNEPDLVARVKSLDGKTPDPDKLNEILDLFNKTLPDQYIEPVLWQEQILFVVDNELLSLNKITYSQIANVLKSYTAQNQLLTITSGSISIPLIMGDDNTFTTEMFQARVTNTDNVEIAIGDVITESRSRDIKKVISGNEGDYYPINLRIDYNDVPSVISKVDSLAKSSKDFDVTYSGSYFSSREMIRELIMVLFVALLLLFFILAAQFESFIQPLIIILEILIDIVGALLLLWVWGAGINLMSLIGIVVMAGIIINDSILKVDTINKLRKEGYSLLRAIMTGGIRRIKPIVMTSLTTILALVPFLYGGDMGSDLQLPLSVALIGGMIIGTLVSIFFIPILYYWIYRRKEHKVV